VPDPVVLSKFQQHILVNAVPALLPSISKLKGIYIDYGAEDEFTHIPPGAQALSAQLALSGVPHMLEVYEGDHGNHVRKQVETRVLPWFSKQLRH
jgi:S-formylglutathione hydrolase